MMDTKKNSRLQNTRLAAGLSQSQLAAATGLNVRTLQCYEQGAKDINNAKLSTAWSAALASCSISCSSPSRWTMAVSFKTTMVWKRLAAGKESAPPFTTATRTHHMSVAATRT